MPGSCGSISPVEKGSWHHTPRRKTEKTASKQKQEGNLCLSGPLFLPTQADLSYPSNWGLCAGSAPPGPREAQRRWPGGLTGSPGGLLKLRDRRNGRRSGNGKKTHGDSHSFKGSRSWDIKSGAKGPRRTGRGARCAAGQQSRKRRPQMAAVDRPLLGGCWERHGRVGPGGARPRWPTLQRAHPELREMRAKRVARGFGPRGDGWLWKTMRYEVSRAGQANHVRSAGGGSRGAEAAERGAWAGRGLVPSLGGG